MQLENVPTRGGAGEDSWPVHDFNTRRLPTGSARRRSVEPSNRFPVLVSIPANKPRFFSPVNGGENPKLSAHDATPRGLELRVQASRLRFQLWPKTLPILRGAPRATGVDWIGRFAGRDMDRILIHVRNKQDRHRLEDWLSGDYEIVSANTEELLEERFDLAIVDGPSLKQLHSRIRERRNDEEPVLLPFLLVAFPRAGSTPTRHLGRLVDDLLVRPIDENELRARVASLLRMRRLSLELKKEHDRVVKLSVTDDVSGFNNTRYLHRYLDRVLASPSMHDEELSLVFFDLDNFKRVVDTHGHLLGSKVLREVAQAAHHELDEDDRIVRYGGDEFIVILPRQGRDQAMAKVQRLRRALVRTPFLQKEHLNVHVTASFGVATFPHDARDKHELLAEADRCLFESKAAGKNRISAAGARRRADSPDESVVLAE